VLKRDLPAQTAAAINERIAGLLGALDQGRKDIGWQLRARVCERPAGTTSLRTCVTRPASATFALAPSA
jgi:hypothetical protein